MNTPDKYDYEREAIKFVLGEGDEEKRLDTLYSLLRARYKHGTLDGMKEADEILSN